MSVAEDYGLGDTIFHIISYDVLRVALAGIFIIRMMIMQRALFVITESARCVYARAYLRLAPWEKFRIDCRKHFSAVRVENQCAPQP